MKRHVFRPNHDALDGRAIPGVPWGPVWMMEVAGALASMHLIPVARKPPPDRISHPLTIRSVPNPAIGVSSFIPIPSHYTSSASPSTPTVGIANATPIVGHVPRLHPMHHRVHRPGYNLLA